MTAAGTAYQASPNGNANVCNYKLLVYIYMTVYLFKLKVLH